MKTAQAKSRSQSGQDPQYAQKKEAVFRTAAQLFRERGYDATSLNELAELLNVTKPTVYYYARSKDDLILQIKLAAQEEVLGFMRAIETGPGRAYDKLREIMLRYASFMTTDYGICLALVPAGSMAPDSRALVYARVKEANQILYRILDAGRKDRSLAIPDTVIAAHALFGSLNWMGSWHKPKGRIEPEKVAEMQVHILLNGIRGPNAPLSTAGAPPLTRAKTSRRGAASA